MRSGLHIDLWHSGENEVCLFVASVENIAGQYDDFHKKDPLAM